MKNIKTLKMNDEVIAHIAKALQIALITGTDIVDNLRLIELVESDGNLVLSPNYKENFSNNLESLIEDVPDQSSPFSS